MSPEDMQRFLIFGTPWVTRVGVACDRPGCGWSVELPEFATLAELVQRAEEHGEVCR